MDVSTLGQAVIDEQGEETPLVHYAYHTGRVLLRRGRKVPQIEVACAPGMPSLAGWRCSGEPAGTNCPRCQKTPAFIKHDGEVRAALAARKK